jgi:hypothetical protein
MLECEIASRMSSSMHREKTRKTVNSTRKAIEGIGYFLKNGRLNNIRDIAYDYLFFLYILSPFIIIFIDQLVS